MGRNKYQYSILRQRGRFKIIRHKADYEWREIPPDYEIAGNWRDLEEEAREFLRAGGVLAWAEDHRLRDFAYPASAGLRRGARWVKQLRLF